jgi:actinorhodin biosynthesis protein ActVIA
VTSYSTGNAVEAATYYELKSFYADHMAMRDRGDTEGWLDAFDDDATVSTNVFDESSFKSKKAFAPEVRNLDNRFAAAGIQRRHELSTFVFTRNEDSTVSARYYAILLTTSPESISRMHSTSVASDVLVRTEKNWRVLSREVLRDDLARLRITRTPTTRNHIVRRIQRGESFMTKVVASKERLNISEIHCQVEQFYASQMQVLDGGDAAAWAATFTEDGVFASNGMPEQVAGRAELETGAAHTISQLIADGVTRRHIVSNIRIEPISDDVLQVSSCVPVIDTIDGEARIKTSTVMRDTLTRSGVTWLVSHRMVMRDDIRSQ